MRTDTAQDVWLRPDPLEHLAERIRTKQAKVAVVGLGYVGLPLLVSVGRSGFSVMGFDVDRGRVESLRAGHSFLVDVTDTEVVSLDGAEFREDPAALADADVVLICVPTPLTDHTPDLAMVREAVETVGRHLAPGRLVDAARL